MINDETVLILGAGASKPYGFPLGYELRDDVLKITEGEFFKVEDFKAIAWNDVQDFKYELKTSGHSSVDAFLEERNKWLKIGKFTIAMKLLSHEKYNSVLPPNQPMDHWYEALWQKLRTKSWAGFKKNKINIITFNYDRSFERYLLYVIKNNYKITEATAIKSLPIVHVHGSLGPFKDYGRDTSGFVKIAADSIKIVHESDTTTKEFIKANRILSRAKRILFIGFGYHPQNMAKFYCFNLRLAFRERIKLRPTSDIYGTHKGLKKSAWEKICRPYFFSDEAAKYGAGTISEFLTELL